jgi:hypothetical protein
MLATVSVTMRMLVSRWAAREPRAEIIGRSKVDISTAEA